MQGGRIMGVSKILLICLNSLFDISYFQAFVMTGDRMINLAKTPANIDFQSKYYKQHPHTARTLDQAFESIEATPASNSLPASPVEGSSHNEPNLPNQRKSVSIILLNLVNLRLNLKLVQSFFRFCSIKGCIIKK